MKLSSPVMLDKIADLFRTCMAASDLLVGVFSSLIFDQPSTDPCVKVWRRSATPHVCVLRQCSHSELSHKLGLGKCSVQTVVVKGGDHDDYVVPTLV